MLLAETTILVHFKSVGIILLILHCVVVSLLTFLTSQCYFNSHFSYLRLISRSSFYREKHSKKKEPFSIDTILPYIYSIVKHFFSFFLILFYFNSKKYYTIPDLVNLCIKPLIYYTNSHITEFETSSPRSVSEKKSTSFFIRPKDMNLSNSKPHTFSGYVINLL